MPESNNLKRQNSKICNWYLWR